MRKLTMLLALSAGLLLSACQTPPIGTPGPTPQEQAQQIFDNACFTAKAADIGFAIAATALPQYIDADMIKWEGLVAAEFSRICSGPAPNVTSSKSIVNFILDQAAAITKAVNAAKTQAAHVN